MKLLRYLIKFKVKWDCKCNMIIVQSVKFFFFLLFFFSIKILNAQLSNDMSSKRSVGYTSGKNRSFEPKSLLGNGGAEKQNITEISASEVFEVALNQWR